MTHDLATNPAAFNAGLVAVYDAAFSAKGPALERVIAHELAHEYWRRLPEKQKMHYQIATGWTIVRPNGPRFKRESGYVEEDGQVGPHEDFANNIEYFLFDRARLEKLTPGAAAWISQRFGDNFKIGETCESEKK